MNSTIVCTIWVCVDCMLVHANGECGEEPDCEPWNRLENGFTVTMGLSAEEHADTCEVKLTGEHDHECDCETRNFSWSSCEGCGSSLGGERHAFALWQEN